MGSLKVSVIVPVYKVEKYIRRCVDSILNQTFSDFELILVDDGSPDNCGAICDEYAAKDSRVRVIHQENQGQAAARNHGVAQAQSEWICFVDSDDMIHPQMLEHLYRAVTETGAGMATCELVEGEAVPLDFGRELPFSQQEIQMDEAGMSELKKNGAHRYWIVCCKLVRREIIQKIPFETGRIYEDNAVACRWLWEAGRVADVPNRYYFYQTNPGGTTQSQFTLKKLDLLWALEEQIRFYESVGYETMKREICAYYLNTAAWYASRVRNELNNYKRAAQIRSDMRDLIRENPLESLPLTDEERDNIRKSFHPVREQILRLPRVMSQIFANGGVKELVCRIARKFKKY